MGPALDIPGLLQLLDAGATVLLPTQRAARALRDHFDRRQRSHGLLAWEPPRVLTWSAWTDSLWSQLTLTGADDRVLLNRVQEQALWSAIIAGSPQSSRLGSGSLHELLSLAQSALQLAAAHLAPDQLQQRLQNSADSFDSKAFVAWHAAFAAHCQRESLLPRPALEPALERHARTVRCALSPDLHLAGFDRLTPAQIRLLQTFQAAGATIHTHALQTPQPGARLSLHEGSPHGELRWALRWFRENFQQAQVQDPGRNLAFALVLPDPAAERHTLEPLLRELLAPELERPGADLSSTPWHFTSGPPLSSLPLIQHALLLLRWTRTGLPIEEIGRLLLSPFFAHSDPTETRARFEMATLRDRKKTLVPELSLSNFLKLTRDPPHGNAPSPGFPELHRVARLIAAPARLTGTGSHADWAEFVRTLLRAGGWPGSRTLTAAEFSATEAWDSLLDLISTLDLHSRRLQFAEFLEFLVRHAHSMPSHEPTDSALLQIARLSDLEGCLFDAALVLRATDQALPAPEQPHPLLGWGLQQSLALPGTDPSASHARTRDVLRSLASRSGDLLLLAPAEDENGPLRLTPLASELGLHPVTGASLLHPEPDPSPLPTNAIPDTTPLPPLPHPHVHGGARVLELQAACGFHAFASLRLLAASPESPTLGMDARETGNILHRAMQHLWSELQTRTALRNLSDEDRLAAVERAVTKAFRPARIRHGAGDGWTETYLQVLQERLSTLILRWLPYELDRDDFEVLTAEHQELIQIGPLELDVRPDRLDKVAGGIAFIDYKTSYELSTGDWLGERPDAPQLPLYTLLAEPDEVRALAFARLRPGQDMGWIPLQDQAGIFPGKRPQLRDLAAEIARWRDELERLAYDFAAGRADVDPKTYPKTCQYCEHRLLCRLDPSVLPGAAGREPDPEAEHG